MEKTIKLYKYGHQDRYCVGVAKLDEIDGRYYIDESK